MFFLIAKSRLIVDSHVVTMLVGIVVVTNEIVVDDGIDSIGTLITEDTEVITMYILQRNLCSGDILQ